MLLGAAEAGFFPGVILYLTYWFPPEYRGRIVAIFMVAIPISNFLGSPISASLLQNGRISRLSRLAMDVRDRGGAGGVLGIASFFVLPNGPADARWLTDAQRSWLTQRLATDQSSPKKAVGHLSLWQVFSNKYVLAASLIYAGASGSSQVLSLWQPQIIKSFGLTNMETGLVNSISIRHRIGTHDPFG